MSWFNFSKKLHPSIENTEKFTLRPLLGTEFGLHNLDLLETIGTGSFGRVRLVRKLSEKTYHALKILKKSKIVKQKQLQHVKDQIKILANFRSEHMIQMEGLFQDDINLYYLLEYVPGGELFSHLRRKEQFDEDLSKFYCVEIASVLSDMHSLGIAYRDLKPENILLDQHGHIKLADFGFSKIILDRTFTLCGTPEYLAPEIIQGNGYGTAVDWWALGILLFEMLAGYPPFYDHNPFGVYKKILKGAFKHPKGISSQALSAIKGFLNSRRYGRLGTTRGVESLSKNSFFRGVDWDSARKKLIIPLYQPLIGSDGDTSNFDFFPEEEFEDVSVLNQDERNAFADIDEIIGRARAS